MHQLLGDQLQWNLEKHPVERLSKEVPVLWSQVPLQQAQRRHWFRDVSQLRVDQHSETGTKYGKSWLAKVWIRSGSFVRWSDINHTQLIQISWRVLACWELRRENDVTDLVNDCHLDSKRHHSCHIEYSQCPATSLPLVRERSWLAELEEKIAQ